LGNSFGARLEWREPSASLPNRGLPARGDDQKLDAQRPRACDPVCASPCPSDRILADEVRDEAFRDDLEPNDRRVRVDALKWLLSKLKPDRYGLDRLLVLGDQANPVHHLHKTVSVADLTDAQLDALQTFCQRMLDAKQD